MSKRNILYPSVDPLNYLDLAKELASRLETCTLRTAVDRIYYATFLFCRDNLAAKNYILPKYASEDHLDVTNALRRRNVLGSLGNEEYRLHRARNCTTYNTNDLIEGKSNDICTIDWMFNTAKEIIKRVEALPVNPSGMK